MLQVKNSADGINYPGKSEGQILSGRASPSSVSTTDFALPRGSRMYPFSKSRFITT